MKPKTLFIVTVILVAVTLIIVFFTQQALKRAPLPQEAAVEESAAAQEPAAAPTQPSVAKRLALQGAITIIESPRKENKTPPPVNARENETRRAKTPSSSQGASLTAPASAPAAAAGVTVINKEPTPVEKKEMQSKGIVLY